MFDRDSVAGIAALTAALTFVVGFAMAATVLSDYAAADPAPATAAAFVADHQAALILWHIVILIGFGLALIPLVLALAQRVRAAGPLLAATTAALGIIWAGLVLASGMINNVAVGTVADLQATNAAQAATVWAAVDAVQSGVGGANEVVGGLWVALVSAAAVRADVMTAWLSRLGLVAGAAGVVTVVPALEAAGAVFGVGMIVWFAWVGLVLVRPYRAQAAQRRTAVA